jgi:RNA polymerase sigma-70 factor (ECF subfamily)
MSHLGDKTDSQLLRKARGNPDAFQEFYRRHCVRLNAWLRGQTGDAEVAAELTAETFAQALLSLKRFRGTGDDGSRWLFGIARNLRADYFRKRRVERGALDQLQIEVSTFLPEPDAFEAMTQEDLGPDLLDAIDRLPEHERQALLLKVVSKLSYTEVASQLDCSENAARIRVFKALRSLRAGMRNQCASEPQPAIDGGIAND